MVSVSENTGYGLKQLAKIHKMPVASFASRILDDAIELEEEKVLAEMAHTRATKKGVKYLSHEEVWADLLP